MTTITTKTIAAPLFANRDQYESAIAKAGLSYTEQSGFLKIEAPNGLRLYVAATKSVRRVDLAGFETGLGTLTKVPHVGPFGKVKQQMIVGKGPDADLATFEALLTHMLAQPKPAPVVKAPKAPKAPVATKDMAGSVPSSLPLLPTSSPETDEAKAKRALLIAQVAAEKGVKISKQSIAYNASK